MPLPSITLPTFNTTLPSDENTIVTMNPMTVGDEKSLLMAQQSFADSGNQHELIQAMLAILVDKKVSPKNLQIKNLSMFDFEWLFFQLRANSVGGKIELTYSEPSDEEEPKQHHFLVMVDDIKPQQPKEKVDNFYNFANFKVLLNPVPIKTYISPEYINNEKKQLTILLRNSVNSIVCDSEPDKVYNQETLSTQELDDWIGQMPAGAYQHIQKYIANQPTFHHELNYKDTNGEDQKIVLETLNDFFPFL